MSDQNIRMRPRERTAKGMKAAAPEASRRHSMTSHRAARPKDLGRTRAAKTKVAKIPATAPSHTLLRMLKTVLCTHFRHDRKPTVVTVVTPVCFGTNAEPGMDEVYSKPSLAGKRFLFNNMQQSRHRPWRWTRLNPLLERYQHSWRLRIPADPGE